ncbi:MAG TPA: pyridoxal phosphate-dependent aminotransferase [Saprospiraceae bacterium]|nr:pyridoxal phosphate-dependent aminotransferase [Saprospiraceae bacterium]
MQLQETRSSMVRSSSFMAENLIPSEIIKLAAEVQQKIQNGEKIYNLTIGDFDPRIFRIPKKLEDHIIQAYRDGQTNYPAANGMAELRQVLSRYIQKKLRLQYQPEEVLVSSGARPLIYAAYKTLLDPGDVVLYPVPSWNNNHYCHLSQARGIALQVDASQHFMPSAKDILPHLEEATMIALCSPQNPTGTVFTREALLEICQLVLRENLRRQGIQKPLYILYDQIYWELTFGDTKHFEPVGLVPELKDYVIYIDGLSKVFAATGLRVGWAFGPKKRIDQMRAILSHVGAWAPKAEQVASAWFLEDESAVQEYLDVFKPEIHSRLQGLYEGLDQLRAQGYPIEAIHPMAAIYLTVRCPWTGMRKPDGSLLQNQKMVTEYILNSCKVAMVPFNAFGSDDDSEWYRISVGTLKTNEIASIIAAFKQGMDQLEA